MSRKRKNRGKSRVPASSSQANDQETGASNAEVSEAAAPTRRQRRAERVREQRTQRKAAQDRSKGIRPWILPGIAGIAVIAIVLVGVFALNSDDGSSAAAARVPSPSVGEPTAQVVIHEYGDFQCAFCGVFSRSIKPELKERYIDTGIARLVWHDFAWYGDESRVAANAARCAAEQGQFWEYHDLLFERQQGTNQGTFSRDNLKRFGALLGLEAESFDACVDSTTYYAAIDADMRRVRDLGLNGTPSFIIGEQRVIGAQPIEVFEQAIAIEQQRAG